MSKFKNILISGVAGLSIIGLSAGYASAADYAAPESFDWTGFYLGGHVGYGEADLQGDWCPSECEFSMGDLDMSGFLGGAQAGYNWQMDSLVLGIEGDISFPAWSDTQGNCDGDCTSNGTANIDALASIRARLGVAFMERGLLYATGGLAYADGEFTGYCAEACGSQNLNAWGGVFGGGLEYAVVDNVSLRAEGLYYMFDDKNSIEDFEESSTGDSTGIDDAFVIRIGMNWLIN